MYAPPPGKVIYTFEMAAHKMHLWKESPRDGSNVERRAVFKERSVAEWAKNKG